MHALREGIASDLEAARTDRARRDDFIATYFPRAAGQPWLSTPVERFDDLEVEAQPFLRRVTSDALEPVQVADIVGSGQYGTGHPWRDHLWVIKRTYHIIDAVLDPTYFHVDLQGTSYSQAISFARIGQHLYCTEGNHRSTLARFLGVPHLRAHVTTYVRDIDLARAHAAIVDAGHEVTFRSGWDVTSLGLPWGVKIGGAGPYGLLYSREHVLDFAGQLGRVGAGRLGALRVALGASPAQAADWRDGHYLDLVRRAAWARVRSR